MFGVGWGANQFSPLATVYAHHAHLPSKTFAALVGIYAAGLIPALLVSGWLSDRHGRRWVLVRAAAVSITATLILIVDPVRAELLGAGRVLAGIASGAAFVAGSAWVKELSSAAPEGAGARRAAIALSAGFGIGPLVSGIVAQWGPWPTVLPYVPHLLLMTVALTLVWGCPETVPTGVTAAGPRTLIPPTVWTRAFLLGVAAWAPWVFGAATISFVTAAKLAASHAGGVPIAFAGAVAGITLLTGVVVQPYARRLGRRGRAWPPSVGLLLVVLGFGTTAWLADSGGSGYQVALMVPVALLLGSAYGMLLVAGLLEAQRLANPAELAGVVAVFYTLIYLGFAAPYLLEVLSGGIHYAAWLLVGAAVALLTVPVVLYAVAAPRAGQASS